MWSRSASLLAAEEADRSAFTSPFGVVQVRHDGSCPFAEDAISHAGQYCDEPATKQDRDANHECGGHAERHCADKWPLPSEPCTQYGWDCAQSDWEPADEK